MSETDGRESRQQVDELQGLYDATLRDLKKHKAKAAALRRRVHDLSAASSEHRRLRRLWAVPVTQPMILISQVHRSGGTLLSRLFDGHPQCFAHPMELSWGRPSKWDWPSFEVSDRLDDATAFSSVKERWVEKLIRQGGYAKYSNWSAQHDRDKCLPYPFVFDRALAYEMFKDAFSARRVASRRNVLDAYLTSLFNGWLDYQNLYAGPKRRVTCFVPRLQMQEDSVERFFADYPDGLLLTVVRDPESWLASALRHFDRASADSVAQDWFASTRASLAAADRHPDRVLVILFEDLVLETEATMRRICARADLTFDEVMLRPTFNSMPVLSDSSFTMVTGIDPDVTHRGVEGLSTTARAALDEEARPLYREVERRHGLAGQLVGRP